MRVSQPSGWNRTTAMIEPTGVAAGAATMLDYHAISTTITAGWRQVLEKTNKLLAAGRNAAFNWPDTMLTMRAITYARQSKQREDESQGSPEAQRKQTRALIDSRGWTFVDHYEDLGASGYDPKAARPGLDAA